MTKAASYIGCILAIAWILTTPTYATSESDIDVDLKRNLGDHSEGPVDPQILAIIAESTNTTTKLQRLVEYAKTNDCSKEVVETLLNMAREPSNSSMVTLAADFWNQVAESLKNERNLFLRLISHRGHHLSIILNIVTNMSPSAMSVSTDDDTTALELHLSLKRKGDWREIAVLLAKHSSSQDRERARIRSLEFLSPDIWAHIFHEHNMDLLRESTDFTSFSQRFLSEHPGREIFLDAIVLKRIVAFANPKFWGDSDESPESPQEIMNGVDVRRLLSNCELLLFKTSGLFPWCTIFRLGAICNQSSAACGDLFLELVPFIIRDRNRIYELYSDLMRRLWYEFNSKTEVQFLIRVLRRLTTVFAERSPAFVRWLLADRQHSLRDDLMYTLAESMRTLDVHPTDEDASHQECSRHAVHICSQFRDNPEHRMLTSVILALALSRMRFDKDYVLLDQLADVDDEQLRFALAVNITKREHSFLEELSNQNRSLYERFCRLLPGKLPLTPFRRPDAKIIATTPKIRNVERLEDDYQLLDIIGRGSFASVHRARCLRDGGNMEVAIKIPNYEWKTEALELEFVMQLCYQGLVPGLVPLLDIFRYGGKVHFVMELIEGPVLKRWRVPQSIPAASDAVRSVFLQLATVLHQIHSMGWSHGDLSHLNNIMVSSSTNMLYLIDFGFAQYGSCECCHSLVGGHGDFHSFLDRCADFLDILHCQLRIPWYERLPGELRQFEEASSNWLLQFWGFESIMADPVFDCIREQLPAWNRDRYLQYPDMSLPVASENVTNSTEPDTSPSLLSNSTSSAANHKSEPESSADLHVESNDQPSNAQITSNIVIEESVPMKSNHTATDSAHVIVIICCAGISIFVLILSYILYLQGERRRQSVQLNISNSSIASV